MFELTANEKAEVVANCDHLSRLKYSKALSWPDPLELSQVRS